MYARLIVIGIIISSILFSDRVRAESYEKLLTTSDSLARALAYDSAIAVAERALAEAQLQLGAEDTVVARILSQLGVYYGYGKAQFDRAEVLWKNALSIVEKTVGPDHRCAIGPINNLAIYNWTIGRYSEAETLYLRALRLAEKAMGREYLGTAAILANLAALYKDMGKYAEAEPLLLEAIRIREKLLGPDHPEVAKVLNNLAINYRERRKFTEAEPLFIRALSIKQKALGEKHPDVATTILNLATIYTDLGDDRKAESLYVNAADILENTLGSSHPKTAAVYMNWADTKRRQGHYDDAIRFYGRAMDALENTYGPDHPDVASCLIGLGSTYLDLHKADTAQDYYGRALAVRENILGSKHPFVAATQEDLSRAFCMQHKFGDARAWAARAFAIRQSNFHDLAVILSENDALKYSHYIHLAADRYFTAALSETVADTVSDTQAADIALLSKGAVSDELFERQRQFIGETDSATSELAEALRQERVRLSHLFINGPDPDVGGYRADVDSLLQKVDNLEHQLSARNAGVEERENHRQVNATVVASHLPKNTALVEYLIYNHHNLATDSSQTHYLVVVITHDNPPVIIGLGPAAAIDSLISLYNDHMLRVAAEGYSISDDMQSEYQAISRSLYESIWRPIERYVGGSQAVFIAPDGRLNQLAFAGLTDGGQYLIERFALHYLSAGRDIIHSAGGKMVGNGLLAIGDPDYDAPVFRRMSGDNANDVESVGPDPFLHRRGFADCAGFNDVILSPLPGTRKEVEAVAAVWKRCFPEPAAVLCGSAATEDTLKALATGKRVIHLATHGYYLDGCEPAGAGSPRKPDAEWILDNPLLLSGLFFAGANLHGEGADSAGLDDGILTAYEVSSMNLAGTQMVVLSACETGRGALKSGEGVYGLRRAFQMAGARTVVCALWPVSDLFTSEILRQLYDRGTRSLPDAMREIQLRKIDQLRREKLPDHPFAWGTFIILGDWK